MKKKDHILDTTKKVDTYHKKLKKDYVGLKPVKVTRPNFRKYLRDKIDMKVRVNPELSEELQKIMELEEGVSNYWNCTPPKHDFLIIRTAEPSAGYSFIFADKSYGLKYTGKEYNPETDTLVEKVEEPKPIKTVGIDNSDVTLVLTAQHEPTPLQIAKMIRDNGYNCNDLTDYTCFQGRCPLSELRCGWSPNLSPNKESERKKLIDDYISEHEPVKDCPVNSEIPQPIKLPDFVYSANKFGVSFVETGNMTFTTNEKGELLLNGNPCFATPEEALQVAKKLWNGEGK